jgi:hypothetical protein
MPSWLVLAIELCTVWALVWIGVGRSLGAPLNKAFLLVQSGSASITMVTASYTNYLVDLSGPMAFGAGMFGAIKLANSLDAGWSRARPGLRAAATPVQDGNVLMVGYRDSEVNRSMSAALQRHLESKVGLARVIRVDDLFGGESFARKVCEDYSCQFCFVDVGTIAGLRASVQSLPFGDRLDFREVSLEGVAWNPEQDDFRRSMAPNLLRQCADLMDTRSPPGGKTGI